MGRRFKDFARVAPSNGGSALVGSFTALMGTLGYLEVDCGSGKEAESLSYNQEALQALSFNLLVRTSGPTDLSISIIQARILHGQH